MSKTFDLRTIQGYDTWIANASVGTHTIKISAKSTNPLYTESNKVIAGTISKYLIDPTLNNVTADASNPTTIISNEQKTLIYYADGTNFTLPNDVTVTNATKDSWTVITQYELTGTATNTTISSASTWVDATTGAATITVGADGTSYKLPTKINITGYANDIPAGTTTTISNKCTVLFTRTSDTSGTIAFNNVTDDVSFSVVGEAAQTGETWVINENWLPPSNNIFSNVLFTTNDAQGMEDYEFGVEVEDPQFNKYFCIYGIGRPVVDICGCSGENYLEERITIGVAYNYITRNEWLNYSRNDYSWDVQTNYAGSLNKTIHFLTAPTGDLLTWLQANAVKQ